VRHLAPLSVEPLVSARAARSHLFAFLIFVSSVKCFAPSWSCEQETSSIKAFRMANRGGVPTDWTHSHIFFPWPSTSWGDSRDGIHEPPLWLQQLRRPGSQDFPSAETRDGIETAAVQLVQRQPPKSKQQDSRDDWRQQQDSDMSSWPGKQLPHKRDWTQSFQTGDTVYTFTSPTSPATFSSSFSSSSANPKPNCSTDYVVFTLPTGGGSSFPRNFNIIAYNNLYVSAAGGSNFCSGTAPIAIFEYDASSAAGTLNGSPTLSIDGKLIAFVENATAAQGGAVFHVLKWRSGDVQNADALFPAAYNLSALPNCATNGAVAPCEYNLPYTASASSSAATLSSPFVDYSTDTAYVSDDGGNVYAIAPVFSANPTHPPAVLSGWPVEVKASLLLTPPVYDPTSKNVFVASTTGTEFFIRTAGSRTGSCLRGSAPCVGSNTFAFTGGGSIQEAPVVDSITGRVWVFGTQTGGPSGSYVVQTDTKLSASSVVKAKIGIGTRNAIHAGTPDYKYFTDAATGKFYVCGQNTAGAGQLYAFGFDASGVMNTTPVAGSPFLLAKSSNANAPCTGALAEVFDESHRKDRLFVGVKDQCANTVGGTSGCVMSFDITSTFPKAVANQLAVAGGTSSITADNVTDASATQITTDIYFMLLGAQRCLDYNGRPHTGTCAVSATQSSLQ
jgi:hypothetical protein